METIAIRKARLSFPDLFNAVQYENTGPFKYRCTFLIPKENVALKKQIDAAIKKVATEKWGAKADAVYKAAVAGNKVFISDGDNKAYNGYADNWAVVATRDETAGKPVIVDFDKSPLGEASGKLYSGCYVNGTIDLWAQDNAFGKGIRATLINVQFVKDGESFGGAVPASDTGLDDLSFADDDDDDAFA